MSQQEDIGKAILSLKALYPNTSTSERSDMVHAHIAQYGSPPHVISTNGSGAGK